MKWLYAGCGALVVGMLLVGSVHAGHAGARRSGQRSGAHSGARAGLRPSRHPGRHWRALRPGLPWQLPWEWLQQDPELYDPNSGIYDPAAEGYDPNSEGPQPEVDTGGATVEEPAVTPNGGNQRRPPKFTNGSPRTSGSRSRGR